MYSLRITQKPDVVQSIRLLVTSFYTPSTVNLQIVTLSGSFKSQTHATRARTLIIANKAIATRAPCPKGVLMFSTQSNTAHTNRVKSKLNLAMHGRTKTEVVMTIIPSKGNRRLQQLRATQHAVEKTPNAPWGSFDLLGG